MWLSGKKQSEVAQRFGVSQGVISKIVRPLDTPEALQRKAASFKREFCKNGHPLTPGNLYLLHDGTRKCRLCHLARQRAWEAKDRAQKKASRGAGNH
jgi:hypothetical protein